jgi:hypothetical protein
MPAILQVQCTPEVSCGSDLSFGNVGSNVRFARKRKWLGDLWLRALDKDDAIKRQICSTIKDGGRPRKLHCTGCAPPVPPGPFKRVIVRPRSARRNARRSDPQ